MSISSVGRELLSNVVDKNAPQYQPPPPIVEFERSESHASSSLSDSFEKITFPSGNHLNIPQYTYSEIKSSSTSNLFFKRNPLQKQKIGHRRVDEHGQVTFKTIETSQICESLQLGIRCSVSRSNVPERDVLMKDFLDVEITNFPAAGTPSSPAHKFDDFKFKTYAPNAFRYFRELFGIPTDDYLLSVGHKQLRELSNPGASGSVFYKTMDDRFIIKTVQQKESHFLRKLLPKYFMNLHQNPDTLLPKFYGLYCYICGVHRVRVVVMNNLLPSKIRVDLKFDLKGSSYKRKASKNELNKNCPTLKDLDFVDLHPKGIYLEPSTYDSLMKTIKRDCTVLESFNIMDYSFLIGLHIFDYKDQLKDSGTSTLTKSNDGKEEELTTNEKEKELVNSKDGDKKKEKEEKEVINDNKSTTSSSNNGIIIKENISLNQVKIEINQDHHLDSGIIISKNSDDDDEEETSFQPQKQQQQQQQSNSPEIDSTQQQQQQQQNQLKIQIQAHPQKQHHHHNNNNLQQQIPILRPNNSFSSISMLDQQIILNSSDQFGNPIGNCTYLPPCLDVIHGRTADGKSLLLFCGLIDILQSYELNKKLEHSFKSIITDGKTISVTRPDYYATRFQDFLGNQVFKKDKTLNKLENNQLSTNNMSLFQRKLNTPLISPAFLNLTNSQLFNYSMLSGSSGGTNTYDNQSLYSYKSSIRSAPPLNSNPFNRALQNNINFNKDLQDELTFRRNNLTLNSSITKGRLLTRHGYLESLGSNMSSAFDQNSIFGSSMFEDTMSVASYSTRSANFNNRAHIHRLSEQDETDDKMCTHL